MNYNRTCRVVLVNSVVMLGITLLLTIGGGCVSYDQELGIQNTWRTEERAQFVKGETTLNEVLEILGPPSQVIPLHEETLLYYLREKVTGSIGVFVLYNRMKESTVFDRAIFIFNKDDCLKEYAFSKEAIKQ